MWSNGITIFMIMTIASVCNQAHAQTVTARGVHGQANIASLNNELSVLRQTVGDLMNRVGDAEENIGLNTDRIDQVSSVISTLINGACPAGQFMWAVDLSGNAMCRFADGSMLPAPTSPTDEPEETTSCGVLRVAACGVTRPGVQHGRLAGGIVSDPSGEQCTFLYQCWNGQWHQLQFAKFTDRGGRD